MFTGSQHIQDFSLVTGILLLQENQINQICSDVDIMRASGLPKDYKSISG